MDTVDSDLIEIFQALPKDAQHNVFRFLSGSNTEDELSATDPEATLPDDDSGS